MKHLGGAAFQVRNRRILVVGDSHNLSVGMGLHQSLVDRGFAVALTQLDDTCLEQISSDGQFIVDAHAEARYNCPRDIDTYMKSAKAREADIIIYSANMSTETSRFVSRFVKLAQKVSKNQNVKIVIMDRAVLFGNLHAEAIGAYARGVSPADINAFALNADKHPTITDEINSSLSEAGELDNVTIVSNRRLQCSESSCDFFTDEGDLANWDNSHWTLKGSKIFMSRFIDQYPLLFQ